MEKTKYNYNIILTFIYRPSQVFYFLNYLIHVAFVSSRFRQRLRDVLLLLLDRPFLDKVDVLVLARFMKSESSLVLSKVDVEILGRIESSQFFVERNFISSLRFVKVNPSCVSEARHLLNLCGMLMRLLNVLHVNLMIIFGNFLKNFAVKFCHILFCRFISRANR
jgi:hypothetical protein